jgi:tetratricopeptide (TPR) repeat protein
MKRLFFEGSKLTCKFIQSALLVLLGTICLSASAGYAQEPANIDPLLAKGEMAFSLTNYEEAREWYRKAQEIEPNNLQALLGTGMCDLEAGNIVGAETSFRRALQLAPSNTSVLLGMARTLIMRDDYNGALEMLKRLNAKGKKLAAPVRVAVVYFSAIVFRELGKFDLAKKNFTTVARQKVDRRLAEDSIRQLKQLAKQTGTSEIAEALPVQRSAKRPAATKAALFSGRFGAGFQYDSNVLLEPDEYEFADEADTREVGLLSLKFKPLATEKHNLSLDYFYYQNFHNGSADTKALNISAHMIGVNYGGVIALGSNHLIYGSAITYNRILLALGRGPDYADYSQSVNFIPHVGYLIAGQHLLEFKYSLRNTDFFERGIAIPVEDRQPLTTEADVIRGVDGIAKRDSVRHQVNLSYKIDLGKTSWNKAWVSIKPEVWYAMNRVKGGADPFYEYDLLAGSVGFSGAVLSNLDWRFAGIYEYEDHASDPRPEVNPDLKKRRDNRLVWNVALAYQMLEWLGTEATYSYRTQHSKYDLYTFDRHIAGVMFYIAW